jgi:cytochrome P450
MKEPVELMGYPLEPGTRLYGCIYLTHHREDIYPNSQQFKPERFLELDTHRPKSAVILRS